MGSEAGVLSWSNTSITIAVPDGATTGPLAVVENGVTSNNGQFTVLAQLSVTTVSPVVGAIGSSVTLTGTGFGSSQSDSTASFNGLTAAISSWSNTQIVANVPTGATTGPVSVVVANVTAYGPTFQINSTIQLTDSLGHQSSYTTLMVGGMWDLSNSQGSGCASCTVRGTTQNQFDSNGNVILATDPLGNNTAYSYDSDSNTTTVSQPAVGGTYPTTTYTYNSFGEVLTATDPLGHVTMNTYDSHGNLTSVTTPAPGNNTTASVTHFAYNALGELTQITDPLGRVTTITERHECLAASNDFRL